MSVVDVPYIGIPCHFGCGIHGCSAATHVRSTFDLPMVFAGDASVWHSYFTLGRPRSLDNLVVPVIDLLIASCGLRLINPPNQATHVAGAALDHVGPQWVAMLRTSSWLLPHRGL